MAHLVVVQPNVQSDVPVGLEQGAVYTITGPDGARAVFNDPTDRDFIGFLSAPPSGLDAAEIRESSDLIVEGDGGIHGSFYFGRRPWTLEGLIDPTPRQAEDELRTEAEITNRRINRLQRATMAMRRDATLTWVPTGGSPVQVTARRQGLRISDRLPKRFLISMVSADPRIYGQIVKSQSIAASPGTMTLRNDGTAPSPPLITLRDGWPNPVIANQQTGEALHFGLTTAPGDVLVIDATARTVTLNGANRYSALDFPSSDWWDVQPGDNPIAATPTSGGGSMTADFRDAWL